MKIGDKIWSYSLHTKHGEYERRNIDGKEWICFNHSDVLHLYEWEIIGEWTTTIQGEVFNYSHEDHAFVCRCTQHICDDPAEKDHDLVGETGTAREAEPGYFPTQEAARAALLQAKLAEPQP